MKGPLHAALFYAQVPEGGTDESHNTYRVGSGEFWGDLFSSWLALSGIALALILTYVSDLKDMPIRRWAEVRPVKDRLSLGGCLSLLLKISAALLIVVGLVLHGKTVWDTPPNGFPLIDISITARVLLGGLSAFVIAVLLEK